MTATAVTIRLEDDCCGSELPHRFKEQLGTETYSRGASILEMPDSLQAWRDKHRTARKRADRASRLGYQFDEIDRSQFNDDLHEINTSLPERQGRPMTDGYTRRHNHGALPHYPCDRHRVHTYGVLQNPTSAPRRTVGSNDSILAAYLTLYRCGELGLVSMILGHGDHLRNDIMYLLMAGVIADQAHHGGYLFYNRHDSGTPGLAFYKERVGFHATDIEWIL